jgi:hypothetical protein
MYPLTATQKNLLRLAKDGHVAREIERREEARWLAADDDGLTLLIGLLGRLQASLERPVAPGQVEDDAESVETAEALLDLHDRCLRLIERLEVLAARDEDEAAGIEHKCGAVTMVRPRHIEPKPAPASKPKARSQRTASSAAAAPAPGSAQSTQDGWCNAVVRIFDTVKHAGVVVLTGGDGTTEMTISADVFTKSGLTVLSPNQRLRVRLVSGPDGRKHIDALEVWTPWNDPSAVATQTGSRRVDSVPANPHLAKLEHARAVRERYPGW